jgi:hypothetical protein
MPWYRVAWQVCTTVWGIAEYLFRSEMVECWYGEGRWK